MNMKAIDDYFNSSNHKPFFMVVGDVEYKDIIQNLKNRAITILRISDCCRKDDKVPDLDELREKLETADIAYNYNNVVLLGLGEYLALSGDLKAMEVLSSTSGYHLGSAQVVLLLRCVENQIRRLVKGDRRLLESGRVAFGESLSTSIRFKFSDPEHGIYKINGLKNLLHTLENGASGEISANTTIPFVDSLLPIQRIKNYYEAIAKKINMDAVPKECGTEEMWGMMLSDLKECAFETKRLFTKNGFSNFSDKDFYNLLYNDEYKNWLFYISLKMDIKTYEGKYIGFVLKKSTGLESFRLNIIGALTGISRSDRKFSGFYKERKRLLASYHESEIATFVSSNRVNAKESVYKLTDNTLVEKHEIIDWIASYGMPENLDEIYPALCAYKKKYSFYGKGLDSTFAERLTEYFEKYKDLKVKNKLTEEFLEEVDRLALERIYNRLPKRDELVKEKNDGSTLLVWIDALGVEYLSYIEELAKRYGLKITIEIGRAELPTITSENRAFFDNWPEELRRPKVEELDQIKHKDKGGYYYSVSNNTPSEHLAKELVIIEQIVDNIASILGQRSYNRVVIASDHGASRLAVLKHKEEKYETETQGEHSGRCCKYFSDCDLPFAISEEDKGYIVLADYGRFKGSRAANVEVHGGASLEEVVVPVITLSLKDSRLIISVVEEDNIKADYKTGISVTLYVNKTINELLAVSYGNKRYETRKIDNHHFEVEISDIKRAGTYKLGVFLGDDLASHLEIKVSGKSASMNDDFDELI